MALLWTMQDQPTIVQCIRKLFLTHEEGFRFGSTAEAQLPLGPPRLVMSLAKVVRVERSILTR